jgi:hypothetical protein
LLIIALPVLFGVLIAGSLYDASVRRNENARAMFEAALRESEFWPRNPVQLTQPKGHGICDDILTAGSSEMTTRMLEDGALYRFRPPTIAMHELYSRRSAALHS